MPKATVSNLTNNQLFLIQKPNSQTPKITPKANQHRKQTKLERKLTKVALATAKVAPASTVQA